MIVRIYWTKFCRSVPLMRKMWWSYATWILCVMTQFELETIKLSFTRSYDVITRSNRKQIFIECIPVGGYSMKDIVTHFRPKIIEAYHKKHDYESGISKIPTVLIIAEMQNLISGTKYHRRYSNRYQNQLIDDRDTDDSDDSEYIPSQSEFFWFRLRKYRHRQ